MAAPAKWKEWATKDGLLKLKGYARDGMTDEEIAKKVGVARRTLLKWKDLHPEIATALAQGKEYVDREVEETLHKRAMGYEYEETETTIEVKPNGEKQQRIKKVKRQVPPDTTAMIFWLKNRKPNEWRDRYDNNISGSLGTVKIVDDIPKEAKNNDG